MCFSPKRNIISAIMVAQNGTLIFYIQYSSKVHKSKVYCHDAAREYVEKSLLDSQVLSHAYQKFLQD